MSFNPSTHPGTASDERGYQRIRVRQDTLANWLKNNPILATGEFGFVIGSSDPGQRLKIGDGTSQFSQLSFISAEGSTGQPGPPGNSSTITVGTTTVLPAGSAATVANSGTASAAILNFGIPTGPQGAPGVAGSPGAPGAPGAAGSMGPQGPAGQSATVTVGTVTALPAGATPTVTNSGPSSREAVLDFGIPAGATGASGSNFYKGEYNNGADYSPGNVVRYNDRLYVRIGEPNPGYPPGTSYWEPWDAVAALDWAVAPAAPDSAGSSGSIARDSDYFYVAVGSSSWKRTQLSTWTIPTVPTAPQTLAASGGQEKAFLSWQPPASDGNSPLVSYVVEYSSDGEDTWTPYPQGASASSISATIPSLTNGVEYAIRLAAVNSVGQGPWAGTTVEPSSSAFEPVGVFQPVAPYDTNVSQTFTVPAGATKMVAFAIGAGHRLGASGGWAYKQWSVTAGQTGTVTHVANDRINLTFQGSTIGGGNGRTGTANNYSSLGGLFYGGDGGNKGNDGFAQMPCVGTGAALVLPVSTSGISLTASSYPNQGTDLLRDIAFEPSIATDGGVIAWQTKTTSADIMIGAARLAGMTVRETNSPLDPAIGSGGYYEFSTAPSLPPPGAAAADYCYGPTTPQLPYAAGVGGGGVSIVDTRNANTFIGKATPQTVVPPGMSAYALYFYDGAALAFPPEPPQSPDPVPPPPPGNDAPSIPFVKVYEGAGTMLVPNGVTRVKAWVIGGGGFGSGAGGAGGGLAWKTWAVAAGQRISITTGRASRDGKPATSSSVTVGADTISAEGGSDDGLTPGGFTANADGGVVGTAASVFRGSVVAGGCISTPSGVDSNCKRMTATDAGGLFNALASSPALYKTIEDCGVAGAVGSGGYASLSGAYDAGFGGGGGQVAYASNGSTTTTTANAGNGLVVLYCFTSTDPVTPPAPSMTAPQGLAATAGDSQVALVWSPPASNGGLTITDYRIEYSWNGGVSWLVQDHPASAVTASTVAGLSNGVDYLFRVAAVAGQSVGPYATTASVTTPAVVAAAFTPRAMIVTDTRDIPIPDGCTTIKAWVIQGGEAPISRTAGISLGRAGMTAHKTWTRGSGNMVSVSIATNSGMGGNVSSAAYNNETITAYRYDASVSYGSFGPVDGTVAGGWYAAEFNTALNNGSVLFGSGGAVANTTQREPAPGGVPFTGSAACKRLSAGNFSGLLDAVALAGGKVADDCGSAAAFGSGGSVDASGYGYPVIKHAGIGGGGVVYGSPNVYRANAGSPAVVLLFTGAPAASSVPGAPTSVTGAAGDGYVSLSWAAPASNGGSAITNYLVQYSLGGNVWAAFSKPTSTATSIVASGLENGSTYLFRVAAVNSTGAGPWSLQSQSVTPQPAIVAPAAPSISKAQAYNGSVYLEWVAGGDGGSPIIAAAVRYSTNGGSTWTAVDPDSVDHTNVTGLSGGTGHIFQASVANEAGVSPWSASSATVTPTSSPTAPLPPSGLTAVAGNSQVSLSWTAPTPIGSPALPASNYMIERSSDGVSWTAISRPTSNATAYVATGLTNGQQYSFRVASENANGIGSFGSPTSFVTPAAAPAAPTGLSAVAGNAQASLSWTAGASNGAEITDYRVEYSTNAGSSWSVFAHSASPATSIVVTGLQNGTPVIFRVAGVNSAGTGSTSQSSASVTPSVPVTAPSAPASITATAGSGSIALTWTAPASNGGSAITDYKVEYRLSNGTSWTVYSDGVGTGLSATVSGLAAGSSYVCRVSAGNSIGFGPAATSQAVTPSAGAPGAPSIVDAFAGDGLVAIQWNAPSGSAITGYLIEIAEVTGGALSWQLSIIDGPSQTQRYITVANNKSYKLRIAATNDYGTSAFVETGSLSPVIRQELIARADAGENSPTAFATSPSGDRLYFASRQNGVYGISTASTTASQGQCAILDWTALPTSIGVPVSIVAWSATKLYVLGAKLVEFNITTKTSTVLLHTAGNAESLQADAATGRLWWLARSGFQVIALRYWDVSAASEGVGQVFPDAPTFSSISSRSKNNVQIWSANEAFVCCAGQLWYTTLPATGVANSSSAENLGPYDASTLCAVQIAYGAGFLYVKRRNQFGATQIDIWDTATGSIVSDLPNCDALYMKVNAAGDTLYSALLGGGIMAHNLTLRTQKWSKSVGAQVLGLHCSSTGQLWAGATRQMLLVNTT